MQLVLDTNGLIVKKRNKAFLIAAKDQQRLISPSRVTSIAVTADCMLSSGAIRLAVEHEIPIFFFDRASKVQAKLWSGSFQTEADIRRQQIFFALQPQATEWIISLFRLKTTHQIDCLRQVRRTRPRFRTLIDGTIPTLKRYMKEFEPLKAKRISDCRQNLMGIEGNIAKQYWATLSKTLPEPLQFSTRSRRPANDEFNAALNYLYGMLYNTMIAAVLAAKLDTQLGFLHVDQYNKPTFVFDIIEPFRPWVDRLLVEQCQKHTLNSNWFEQKEGGYFLNKEGKRFLIPLFGKWLDVRKKFQGKVLSHKNHLYRFAGEFAKFLLQQKFES